MKIDNKLSVFLFLFVLIVSCQVHEKKEFRIVSERASKFNSLLQKYQSVSFDTLNLFSSSELESYTYPFKGKLLDSGEVELVKEALSIKGGIEPFFFACSKFEIDSTLLGLITRVPSIYESSSIKLLLYDKTKHRIVDFIELAETFGDAGDYAEKVSWIYKDQDKSYKGFICYEVSHDNSVENPADTTVETSKNCYLIQFSNKGIDTLSNNPRQLSEVFLSVQKTLMKK
jgi:hypothetical protein